MPSLRQIRLATGLVLYVYVSLHFANHALGNISVGAMESGPRDPKLIYGDRWRSAAILYDFASDAYEPRSYWALYELALNSAGRDSRRPNSSCSGLSIPVVHCWPIT